MTTPTVLVPTQQLPTRVHCDPPCACDICGRERRVLYPRWPAKSHLSLLCGACYLHAEARARQLREIAEEGYL